MERNQLGKRKKKKKSLKAYWRPWEPWVVAGESVCAWRGIHGQEHEITIHLQTRTCILRKTS